MKIVAITNSARKADLFIIRKVIYPRFLSLTAGHNSTVEIIASVFESNCPSVSGDISTAHFNFGFFILDKSLCFSYIVVRITIKMNKVCSFVFAMGSNALCRNKQSGPMIKKYRCGG